MIACKTSRHLMVPNPLIRLTYLDHILGFIMSPWSSLSHNMLYNFVMKQAGLQFTIPCLNHAFSKSEDTAKGNQYINMIRLPER